MLRLLSAGIECFSTAFFIIFAMLAWQYAILKQRGFKKFIAVLIYSFYIMAVFSVTGIPTINTWHVYPQFNFIPLADIINSPSAYIVNTILNIVLFMPLGFLLPCIWEEYRSFKKIIFMGLAVSAGIELLQIFTFRVTDIDDLLSNTTGAAAGYYFGKLFSFKLPFKIERDFKNTYMGYEPVAIMGIILLIKFFLEPFVSGALWDIVLSSPLWEGIK